MKDFVIVTDSSADLLPKTVEELGLKVIQLEVTVEGEEPCTNDKVEPKAFFAKLRDKKGAKTSACGIDRFLTAFEPLLAAGEDVLYLGFSSGLSSTYSSGAVAARELAEKYPERKIYTVDTLCASRGEGLLVWYACQKKLAGASIEEVRDYVEENKLKLCHWFTVDDLFYLKRGGRVSAATAVIGSMLSIKPVLHVDNAGKLINMAKVRGRRASIDALFDKMKATMLQGENKNVFICHGDCLEDAEYLAGRIKTELGIDAVEIGYVGPVIGAHSGPGTLALFFLGNER